jgi:AraC-like DNA-binding protein
VSDVLSDVLRSVRLTGAVFYSVECVGTWAAESPPAMQMAPYIRPGAEHMIQFHAITSGSCYGGLLDEPSSLLQAGDLLVLPQGDRHVLSSAPGMMGEPVRLDQDPAARIPLPLAVRLGQGQGTAARVMCGFLGCDARPFNPLLAALPRKIVLRGAAEKHPIVSQFFELAVLEAQSPRAGSECVLARLSELMFVEALRFYAATLSAQGNSWLAGLSDDVVARALSLLHERPSYAWTVEQLAKGVATSRSVLADRFTTLVGVPPMQYLTQWRVQLAAELLTTTSASLGEIAERVGYGSETALSRAFKRHVGVPPARWREGARVATSEVVL